MVLGEIDFIYSVGSALEKDVKHLEEGALIVAIDSEEGVGKVQGLKQDCVFDMGGRLERALEKLHRIVFMGLVAEYAELVNGIHAEVYLFVLY